MKDLKDGMTKMAQYQMETAQCQAMASALSPMRNKFHSALCNNVMDSISYEDPEESHGKTRDGCCKETTCTRRCPTEDCGEMIKNMELDHKLRETNPKDLLGIMMGYVVFTGPCW
jgi:hypothetical protein